MGQLSVSGIGGQSDPGFGHGFLSRVSSAVIADEGASITEEALSYMRSQIGRRSPTPGWNRVVTEDAIRHFALGVGDDNPLWWDEAYAKASPLGGLTAPPCYLFSHVGGPRLSPADGKASTDEFLPGAMGLLAGQRWRWLRPVCVGETITAEGGLVDVSVGASRFGGRSVTQVERLSLTTETGELVAEFDQTIKRFERRGVRSAGAHAQRQPPHYTQEDRDRFARQYAAEAGLRRGADIRRASEVKVGDSLGPMLKGPLTLTSMIGFLLGVGSALLPANRMREAFLTLHPGGRLINPETGVADCLTGGHIEPGLVKMSGMPAAYDHGIARFCWFAHLVGDWAGDGAELKELDAQILKPNFVGDVTWLSGRVTAVGDDGPGLLRVALTGTNQLGEETCRAQGRVKLPL